MAFKKIATGLQHIGLPTNDIKKTIEFYTALGFEVAYQTVLNGETPVAFLKLGDLVIETYENGQAVGKWGAIDHVAINVTDVNEARRIADEMGLKVIEAGELPFWANGVKYFTIEGPNNEKVEFNQYL
ncbi:MAG: VOC family protein [Clostridiales bacterium]|nr:VOC family protein [Clostridiales bacterium]